MQGQFLKNVFEKRVVRICILSYTRRNTFNVLVALLPHKKMNTEN